MYVRWEVYYNKRSPYTWHDSLFLVLFCLHLSSWEFPFWITNGVVESSRCELVIINAIITVTHNATTMAHWRNASFVKMWIEKKKLIFQLSRGFPGWGVVEAENDKVNSPFSPFLRRENRKAHATTLIQL